MYLQTELIVLHQDVLQQCYSLIRLQTLVNDGLDVSIHLKKINLIFIFLSLNLHYLHVSLSEVVADGVEVDEADVAVGGGHVRPGNADHRPDDRADVEPGPAALLRIGVPAVADGEEEEDHHHEEDGHGAEEESPPHGQRPVVPGVQHLQTEAVRLRGGLATQHRERLQPGPAKRNNFGIGYTVGQLRSLTVCTCSSWHC